MLKEADRNDIEFQFIHGDFTHIDWFDADIVFMNSTCFDDPLMHNIARLVEKTRPGTFILSTTNRYWPRLYFSRRGLSINHFLSLHAR